MFLPLIQGGPVRVAGFEMPYFLLQQNSTTWLARYSIKQAKLNDARMAFCKNGDP